MNTPGSTPLHWPCLLIALAIMLGGTGFPLLFARADGHADHGLATMLFWAMSAGFVRGVGFVPRHWLWRLLFSAWACAGAGLLAILLAASHRV